MTTDSSPPGQGHPADPAGALAGRLFYDVIGALELFTVYLGERLGLYRALAGHGPATSTELAGRTGTAERYVWEWPEHHAASGLLEVDDVRRLVITSATRSWPTSRVSRRCQRAAGLDHARWLPSSPTR